MIYDVGLAPSSIQLFLQTAVVSKEIAAELIAANLLVMEMLDEEKERIKKKWLLTMVSVCVDSIIISTEDLFLRRTIYLN